ncbi:hypothetical protein ACB094_07G166500 [Castanea mollissima]
MPWLTLLASLLVANVMLGNVSTFTAENLWPKTKTNTFLMNGLLKLTLAARPLALKSLTFENRPVRNRTRET